jgi:hypothetical protein
LRDGQSSFDVTLIASRSGISSISRVDRSANQWSRDLLKLAGEPIAAQGAGEVKFGRLADGSRLLATIEPMHGNAAVVYHFNGRLRKGAVRRDLLDDTLAQGHAVWCADFDGDGSDEIVIGHREPGDGEVRGPGIYLFERQGEEWKKQIVDNGGMACEDLIVADFNEDGLLDILAAGRATHNVKIYFQSP